MVNFKVAKYRFNRNANGVRAGQCAVVACARGAVDGHGSARGAMRCGGVCAGARWIVVDSRAARWAVSFNRNANGDC
jgi:hypothetical protein